MTAPVLDGSAPAAEPAHDPTHTYRLLVTEVRLEADSVLSIVLRSPDGAALPAWSPGAHIDVRLPSGLVRQYSLCGNSRDRRTYRIAVLREQAGRGGSAEIHGLPLVGRELQVRGPRNHFALTDSPQYLFVAGGIGVTPILSMVTSLGGTRPWTLHYGGRSRSSMAFVLEATALGEDRVRVVPQDEDGPLDLAAILRGATASTAIYACGPPGLLSAIEDARDRWAPDAPLNVERFAPDPTRPLADPVPAGSAFTVELRRSATTVEVPPERSTLDAIRDRLPDVPYSCEEGYCGSCETRVLDGVPDHRDEVLTAEERAAGTTMMICVSRASSRRLVLDL